MRRERRESAIERIQNIQHAAHHSDHVATFRWQAPVCRAAMRHNFRSRITLVREVSRKSVGSITIAASAV